MIREVFIEMLTNFLAKIKNRDGLILLEIIVLGALLRILYLDRFPVGFHSQEAIVGYRAFSLANTARDELGRFLPILFTSFQDYQLPLSTYLLIPFIKFFGLNEFTTRLPFAVLGILAIPAIYGLARMIFPEKQSIAIWSGLFLAINPWGVFLSRTTSEVVLSFHLFLIGFWALLYSNRKKWFLLIAFLAFLASVYSSKVAWFFIPLFFLILFFTPVAKDFLIQKIKLKIAFFAILTLIWLPLLFALLTQPSVKQSLLLNDFSFFSDISILNSINQMRGEIIASGVPFLGRLFYNKSFYLIRILENFLMHFNPRFLFAAGSGQPLLGLTNFGPVFLIFLPATFLGLVHLLRNNDRRLFLLLTWVVLALLPSVFVHPTLDQERAIFLLPVVAFITSIGISNFKSRLVLTSWLIFLVFNISLVAYDTVAKEPNRTQREWLYGYKSASSFIAEQASNYDKVFVTNEYAEDPGPLLVFYLRTLPEKLWISYPPDHHFGFKNWIQRIENIQFGKVSNFPVKKDEKILFIATPQEIKNLPRNKVLETITDLNRDPLLQVGSFIRFNE